MKLRKKYAVWLLFLCVLLICSLAPSVYAESDVEKELNETIDEQLGGIDWSGLEDYFDGLGEDDNKLFDGSFLKKIKKILGGEMDTTAASYLGFLGDVFLGEFNKVLPSLLSVAAICILSGLINRTKTTLLSDSTGELINFVCYGVIILLVLSGVWELLDSTKVTVLRIKQLTNVAMPILLAMMSATGAAVGTKVYQPSVALLSSGITEIIANIILPMFIFTVVFSVISNLSKNIRMDKLSDFFKKTSVWIVGISFTVFTGFLTVQGLTSSTIDGVSIRAAKFATKNYIPILGGYLADGFDLILASSVLIKNSLGVVVLILLVITIMAPVLKIVVFNLALSFVTAIVEPIAGDRIVGFLSGVGKNLTILLVSILAVAFMLFILIMLIIFSANTFV